MIQGFSAGLQRRRPHIVYKEHLDFKVTLRHSSSESSVKSVIWIYGTYDNKSGLHMNSSGSWVYFSVRTKPTALLWVLCNLILFLFHFLIWIQMIIIHARVCVNKDLYIVPGSQAWGGRFESLLDPRLLNKWAAFWRTDYVHLQLKDPLELFLKQREILPFRVSISSP